MKISLISSRNERLEEIRILLADSLRGGLSLRTHLASLSGVSGVVASASPDILLLDNLFHTEDDFSAIEEITRSYPMMAVLLISENQTPEFLLRAMRAGVREIVPMPVDATVLCKALGRIITRIRSQSVNQPGKVIAFLPCKGGSGSTFLGANFAYAIAKLGKYKVALIDLNLQFGDASLFILEQRPAHTLLDVVTSVDRLDADLLHSCMEEVSRDFCVLSAPDEPEESLKIRAPQIEKLLDVAIHHFDYVVVDVSRDFNGVSVCALDKADFIYVVLQMNLPFIRDARRVLNVLRTLGHASPKVNLVINRYEKDSDLDLNSVEKTLGAKIDWMVPNSYKNVTVSVNSGIPIMKLAPKDSVSRKLEEMVEHLVPQEKQPAGGWLHGLLGRGHRK